MNFSSHLIALTTILLLSSSVFAETKILPGRWFEFGFEKNIVPANNVDNFKIHEEPGKVCVSAGYKFCVVQSNLEENGTSQVYGKTTVEVFLDGKQLKDEFVNLENCDLDTQTPISTLKDLKGCKIVMPQYVSNVHNFWGVYTVGGQITISFNREIDVSMQVGYDGTMILGAKIPYSE